MEYTLEQLKAMAYDKIVLINNAQNELNHLNKMIEEKSKEIETEKAEVEE